MRQSRVSGGGRNTVPKPGVDLPDINSVTDLKQLMKFYNILGHGTMSEEKHRVFLIPENTWVLFITRAGIPADKRKSGVLRDTLDDFYFLRKGETEDQWYQRIYTAMDNGTLFKAILYSNRPTDQFSIYEPGDLIQDLELQFLNRHWPFMRLGIWDCPIPVDVKDRLDLLNDVNDIIQHNPQLREHIDALERYKIEYPAYTTGIDKIISFLKDFANITYDNYLKFKSDPYVKLALGNKKIDGFYGNFLQAVQMFKENTIQDQYAFFDHPNNLIQRSPSTKEGNYDTALYNLLTEKKLGYSKISLIDEPLLNTPKYKFVVVDACRSIESTSMPEALYRPRAALTRSMSESSRREVCVTNLLQMTRKKFQELVGKQTISDQSAIVKLLRGDTVLLTDFESSILGKAGNLRTFLERQQFKVDDIVYVSPLNGENGYSGSIADITVNSSGKLVYKIFSEQNGDMVNVPAASVFKSQNNIRNLGISRVKEHNEAVALTRQLEAARLQKEREEQEKAARLLQEAARQRAEAERLAKERNAEQTARETRDKASFETHKASIDILPNKDLISYGKRVTLDLSHLPLDDIIRKKYHNRTGIIKSVGKSKSLGDKFVVAIRPIVLGEDLELFKNGILDKVFEPQYIVKSVKSKGGGKSRRSKKSKQRKTRTRTHRR